MRYKRISFQFEIQLIILKTQIDTINIKDLFFHAHFKRTGLITQSDRLVN